MISCEKRAWSELDYLAAHSVSRESEASGGGGSIFERGEFAERAKTIPRLREQPGLRSRGAFRYSLAALGQEPQALPAGASLAAAQLGLSALLEYPC